MMYMKIQREKWFGDRQFYRTVMAVTLPIMIQNGITSFVNMLDNIMVGQVGTLPMSGVSITNQLLMIFNITIFGVVNAAGIFGAQFVGKGDDEGHRSCTRFKILSIALVVTAWLLVFHFFGERLIGLYLNAEENSPADIALTSGYALGYLRVMLFSLPLFGAMQVFSSSIRETGETVLPMRAGIYAVIVNLCFNYILIFGRFGFPKLGIIGAALATVLSRIVELAVTVAGAVRRKYAFLFRLFKTLRVPGSLALSILKKGTPLMVNELCWSIAMAGIAQCYSTRGLTAVAAVNINGTINNLFMIVGMAMGISISILVGQKLGASLIEEAVDLDRKMIVVSVFMSLIITVLLYLSAPLFPRLYNTSEEVRETAERLLRITALYQPIFALSHAGYFTIRSGGRTILTLLTDGVYTACVNFSLAFLLSRFTSLDVVLLYLFVQAADIPKMLISLTLVHKRVWVNNLVSDSVLDS